MGWHLMLKKRSDETSRNSVAINGSSLPRVPSTELTDYNAIASKSNVSDPDSPKQHSNSQSQL